MMAVSVSSLIYFSDLCTVFETTRNSKKNDKSQALSKFIMEFDGKARQMKVVDCNVKTSFYPVLRLILPQLERERGAYGLKETTLAKRLVKVLCLPSQGSDAMRLINFRTSASNNQNVKDFADAAFWILRKHFISSSNLSIDAVNLYLDSIAQRNADNDPRGLDAQFLKLFQETSAEEQKWLIRIILKDLRLGIGQDRILRLLHPDAPEYFSTNESLFKVCETLVDPSIRLHEIELSIFSPFRPMLSQRCDIVQINKVITEGNKFYIETKFDGERFQIHMKSGCFKYFSRNGYDYTDTYGADFNSGFYTPLTKSAFNSNVHQIILDGEMMGWNTKTKKFGSKGMNFDVKRLTKDSVHQPCFCVIDILLLNDKILTNRPLFERLSILNSVVRPIYGVIMVSQHSEGTSKQDIIDALNHSMDNKEEGIVFKDPLSIYKCNDRKAGWWKMKLEYFENVMNDLDLLIIGGYYGDGRHRLRISGFLVGVIDNNTNPVSYLSFAKISSGLSNEEFEIISKKLDGHWKKRSDGDAEQHGLVWGKEKPDVWIEPQNSCAILVRASELSFSHDFKTNYTLRFPRIQKLRLDKPYYDCFNTTELQELISSSTTSIKKLYKRHLELDDLVIQGKEKKIRRRAVNFELKPVEELSQILSGYQFCVLTGNKDCKKEEVETVIRENGGSIVPIEGPETLCILVGDDHPRVNSCKMHNAPYDLVNLQWLYDILNAGIFKMYQPINMLHTSPKTTLLFNTQFDKYGDSFTEHVSDKLVKDLVFGVNSTNDYIHFMPHEIEKLNEEIQYVNSTQMFQNCIGYFDKCERDYRICTQMSDPQLIEEIEFRFLGGRLSNILDENVSLVVVDTTNQVRINEILAYLKLINNNTANIVDKHFIAKKFIDVKCLLSV